MRVGFRLRAGPVEIALRVFVHQAAFQPGGVRVHQRFILRDVLLLDQGDLLIEPAAQIVMIKPGLVHIIVHGLLLGGGDRHGGQLVKQRRVLPQRAGDAVHREAVLADGRAARHDLRVAAHEALGVLSAVHLHQVGVAVQVVKVLQQRQIKRLPDVLTFDALRQVRRQIDRQLLVADGVLQHGFAKRLEARELLLLLLLRAAGHRQLRTQLWIVHVPGHLVAELDGFKLRAVHQDDAALGVWVGLPGVICPGIQRRQALKRGPDGRRLLHKRVHGITLLPRHCLPSGAVLCAGSAARMSFRTGLMD